MRRGKNRRRSQTASAPPPPPEKKEATKTKKNRKNKIKHFIHKKTTRDAALTEKIRIVCTLESVSNGDYVSSQSGVYWQVIGDGVYKCRGLPRTKKQCMTRARNRYLYLSPSAIGEVFSRVEKPELFVRELMCKCSNH